MTLTQILLSNSILKGVNNPLLLWLLLMIPRLFEIFPKPFRHLLVAKAYLFHSFDADGDFALVVGVVGAVCLADDAFTILLLSFTILGRAPNLMANSSHVLVVFDV